MKCIFCLLLVVPFLGRVIMMPCCVRDVVNNIILEALLGSCTQRFSSMKGIIFSGMFDVFCRFLLLNVCTTATMQPSSLKPCLVIS